MPSFWNAIQRQAVNGKLFSIDKVRVELIDNGADGDALKNFCKDRLPVSFFLSSEECVASYTRIIQWAMTCDRNFTSNALSKFMATDYADPWLVAYAINHPEFIIVTEEKEDALIRKDIPIPEVCKEFGVPFIRTVDLLRSLDIVI